VRAISYNTHGNDSVLRLEERPVPEPERGEIRVRVVVSAVNPTDCKARSGMYKNGPLLPTVPNHDGAGVIDAVGPAVTDFRIGDRVWVTLAGDGRPASGTAQEYTVLPAQRAFLLPEGASFELGASIGIPGLTACRALTVAEDGPTRLQHHSLKGKTVLVAGGAGAVGNAAIQLARWAGAEVIATVSTDDKGALATAAGAHHVVNYRQAQAASEIRRLAPDGVDLIVEVAASANAELDLAVLRPRGTVSVYASDDRVPFNIEIGANLRLNARYQFVLLYTVGWPWIAAAAADINQAIEDGALRTGEDHGLPLHRFTLNETAAAHRAVENAAVGKVLVIVGE
jgi:NADPH2:quinone reductase